MNKTINIIAIDAIMTSSLTGCMDILDTTPYKRFGIGQYVANGSICRSGSLGRL